MTKPQIVGYVMARDDWPLLCLAVAHALTHHVDHVIVLDHASSDETPTGLEQLEHQWPGHLTAFRLDDPHYLQEAATTLMSRVAGFSDYEWVYVFDADEFMLTPIGSGLRDILAEVPPDVDAVRYEVHNWVAPDSFVDTDLRRYTEIRHRARPNVFLDMAGEILADEVECGNMNYFDAPFDSKVIVRGHRSDWIKAGAHGLAHPDGVSEIQLPADRLRAGHVPLLSRVRVAQKCRHGQIIIDSDLPPAHSWQNRMLRRLELAGRLDEFWAAHSIPTDRVEVSLATPTTEPDGALAGALRQAVAALTNHAEHPVAVRSDDPPDRARAPISPAVRAIGFVQDACVSALAERDAASAERDALVVQRDAASAERDALVVQRDAASAERDALVVQRDAASAERDALVASRIWRWSGWYRELRAWLKANGPSRPTPRRGPRD